jgi:hypothetical protein
MPYIEIQGFMYDENILEAAATAKSYEKTYKNVQAEIRAEKNPERRKALAYGNWMSSGRSGRYSPYEIQQQRKLHDLAHIANDVVICTCGLVTEVIYDWENSGDVVFRNAPGHINTATRELATLFVIKEQISKDVGSGNQYWCQTCGDLGSAIQTRGGRISLAALKNPAGFSLL